ncbi:MAG: hypothetical protein R3F19_23265 [Verrucomicrobiales bacterium]
MKSFNSQRKPQKSSMGCCGRCASKPDSDLITQASGLRSQACLGLLAIPPPPDPPFDVETLEPIRTPPEFQWWKPEVSDPAQFELQVPHWSPDFEFQESQQAAQSGESATSWQATELTLDTERTLVLDSDPPAQDEFPEFFYD